MNAVAGTLLHGVIETPSMMLEILWNRLFRVLFLYLRINVKKLSFTPANTGLLENKYPELGSAWKAAHVKVILWFVTMKACEFAAASDDVARL